MYAYNTDQSPIKVKEYGRHIENLIYHITKIKEKAQQTAYVTALVNLVSHTNTYKDKKAQLDTDQLWRDFFVVSNYKLNVNAPCTLPRPVTASDISHQIHYTDTPIKSRCCGKYLPALVRHIGKTLDQNPQPKPLIIALFKIVQQWHKKNNTPRNLLHHIEEVTSMQFPIKYEEIEESILHKGNGKIRKRPLLRSKKRPVS